MSARPTQSHRPLLTLAHRARAQEAGCVAQHTPTMGAVPPRARRLRSGCRVFAPVRCCLLCCISTHSAATLAPAMARLLRVQPSAAALPLLQVQRLEARHLGHPPAWLPGNGRNQTEFFAFHSFAASAVVPTVSFAFGPLFCCASIAHIHLITPPGDGPARTGQARTASSSTMAGVQCVPGMRLPRFRAAVWIKRAAY